MNQDATGDQGKGKRQESGITPAEIDACASRLEGAAARLKEVARLYASSDASDQLRAREALRIIDKYLAGELLVFSTNVER
jgi:hypothetical protein